jgi:hypothetical protein
MHCGVQGEHDAEEAEPHEHGGGGRPPPAQPERNEGGHGREPQRPSVP